MKTDAVFFSAMLKRIWTIAILTTGLALVSLAQGDVIYCNTFDAGSADNVNLNDDPTDPTSFFDVIGAADWNNVELSTGTFTSPTYTNQAGLPAAAAAGDHAHYVHRGGAASHQHGINSAAGTFDAVVDLLNGLEAGKYDLTLSVDMGVQTHPTYSWYDEAYVNLKLYGEGALDGVWALIDGHSDGSGSQYSFKRYMWTSRFEIVDVDQGDNSDYAEGEFLASSFTNVTARFSYAGNHANPVDPEMNVDNLMLDIFVVPEPASLALLGLGGVAILTRRSRRR